METGTNNIKKKAPPQKYQDELSELKECAENGATYMRPNYDSYRMFNRLVFDTTLTDEDREVLRVLGKPQLEFNLMRAYIARLMGEFETHEPTITVVRSPGVSAEDVPQETLDILSAHFRHEVNEAAKEGVPNQAMQNILVGGYTAGIVALEYANNKSFDLVFKLKNAFDPTLSFFDPLAQCPHKGDGRYIGFLYPRTAKEIKQSYTFVDIDKIKNTTSNTDFHWSYEGKKESLSLICEMYKRKEKPITLAKLSNGDVIEAQKYDDFVNDWNKQLRIEQAPIIVDTRESVTNIICRYVFIESMVLEYEETPFINFPVVIGDGDSRMISDPTGGTTRQIMRSYVKDLIGTQKLMNLAGQSWANELENITQQKIKIAQEALPDQPDFLRGYTAPQLPSVLVYKGFKDNNPDVPLNAPETVARQPIPPEIIQAFTGAPQTMQAILGGETGVGANQKDLSGRAMAMSSIQWNAAAKPYLYGYLQYLQRMLQVPLDIFPKFYATARTIPIIDQDGRRTFVTINKEGAPQIKFDPGQLQVSIEAGPSFAIQKSMAIAEITGLSSAMPGFGEFMQAKGLNVLVDNLEIRGADRLQELAAEYQQEVEQQKQVQMQMAMQEQQNNPVLLAAQNERLKIESTERQANLKAQLDTAKLVVEEEKNEVERLKILSTINVAQAEQEARLVSANAEKTRAAVDMMIKITDVSHKHAKEAKELEHAIEMDKVSSKE